MLSIAKDHIAGTVRMEGGLRARGLHQSSDVLRSTFRTALVSDCGISGA